MLAVCCVIPSIKNLQAAPVRIQLDLDDPRPHQHNFFPYKPIRQPKIGIAFSGGGAKGFAHIGVLKALEDAQIPIHYIAGTSIGAVMGGLYAIGYSPDEITEILHDINWDEIFFDTPGRRDLFIGQKEEIRHIMKFRMNRYRLEIPKGLTGGQKLSTVLNELILRSRYSLHWDYNQFEVPLRIVSTNFKGESVVFDSGDLAERMLASMAFPYLFNPVKIGDTYYIDGGILNNIPTDVIQKMGADILVAVNTTSDLLAFDEMNYPWETADQVTSIMQKETNELHLDLADIVIAPEVRGMNMTDFTGIDSTILKGYAAAQQVIPELKRLIQERQRSGMDIDFGTVTAVNIRGLKHMSDSIIRSELSVRPGKRTSSTAVREDLVRLYETGFFENVEAVVDEEENGVVITYLIRENPRINSIALSGNQIFTDEQILARLTLQPGMLFNWKTGRADFQHLLDLYYDNGYSLAAIQNVSFDTMTQELAIEITEGVIGDIQLEGNIHTKNHVILREFPLKIGQVFNVGQIEEGVRNVFSTGLFQRVMLSLVPSNPHPVVRLRLVETINTVLRLGARYDIERGTRGFVELQKTNLLGLGIKSALHFQYGTRDRVAENRTSIDRIFKTYLTSDVRLYYKKREQAFHQEDQTTGFYFDERWGGSFSVGEQIARFGTVSMEARIEQVQISTHPDRKFTEELDLRTLTARSIVDTQDKYPFPNSGYYHHFYYQSAGTLLGGKLSYTKLFGRMEAYIPLHRYHVIHPRVQIGTADETLPFAERFRLGGDMSMYGVREDFFHGRAFLNGSLEYRMQIKVQQMLNWYLSFRYDVGHTWQKNQSIQPKELTHAYGIALALDMPVGPMQIAYGHANPNYNRIYLSLGYRF